MDRTPISPFDGDPSRAKPLQPSTAASLRDYLDIVLENRRLILSCVGIFMLFSLIISLCIPNSYVAVARILPPRETNAGIAALFTKADMPLSGLAGDLIGSQPPAALYVGIMKSRSVADALAQKFNLKELYGKKYIEDVYRELDKRANIENSKKDQIISISVKDRDPVRAAAMANAYVEMLDKINRNLNITQGKRKRVFLEARLREVRSNLEKAELDLKTFQEKYHLVAIEEQAKVAIEGAAEIKGQMIAAQTELQVFKQFGTERQNEALMLKAKIEELGKQLALMESGLNPETGGGKPVTNGQVTDFYIPFNDVPHLSMQLMRLTREAKIQEKLFELLTAQYEMAQIEEAKDVDTIQILDRAVPPEKKDGPKRTRIVLVMGFLAFIGSVLLVFVKKYRLRFNL